METPLGRARGLGSARSGTVHWWHQRLTALALVPLTLWFAVSVIVIAEGDHAATLAWIRNPVAAGLLILMLGAGAYHLKLGLQVVIEDYVHRPGLKLAALIATTFATVALALASVMAVARIWLAG